MTNNEMSQFIDELCDSPAPKPPKPNTMPFGKHKGKTIKSLPKGYLAWLSANCNLSDDLREAVQCALQGK
jgi:hypothetical protein